MVGGACVLACFGATSFGVDGLAELLLFFRTEGMPAAYGWPVIASHLSINIPVNQIMAGIARVLTALRRSREV